MAADDVPQPPLTDAMTADDRYTRRRGLRRDGAWASLASTMARVAPPIAGATVAALMAPDDLSRAAFGILVWFMLACAGAAVRAVTPPHKLLPFVQVLLPVVPAVLVVGLLGTLGAAGLIDSLGLIAYASIIGAAGLAGGAAVLAEIRGVGRPAPRIAVIGSVRDAVNLERELRAAGRTDFEFVGSVDVERTTDTARGVSLGDITELERLVEEHRLDLLLIATGAPRLEIFRHLSGSYLVTSVRVLELTAFYERTLGHVPVGSINDAWFQCVMHPDWARTSRWARVRDVAIGLTVAIVAAPLMAILALLIRRDGGPVFYKQIRIGEGGRPFEMYKLRSMRVEQDADAQWSSEHDPRVTRVGRFMRKTHLDELPQIHNVLRGEMSIVGPRPEQPQMVEALEASIPFYARRHLARPGITGWAQVHCGYAGSESGSAWKLSHDLYYLRHRSAVLDLMILAETVRTLLFDRQFGHHPAELSFVFPEGERALKKAG